MGTYLNPDAPAAKDAVVALYSGGVDSYCMAYLCDPDVLCNVNMGGRYGDAESSRLTAPPGMHDRLVRLHCPAICVFEDAVTSIVPGRNAFLALFGAQYGSTLLLASIYEEAHVGGADKDEGFAEALGNLFDHMFAPQRWLPQGRTVRLKLPVHQLTKAQLVGRALLAGHNPELLARNTFSCYEPIRLPGKLVSTADIPDEYLVGPSQWRECGECGACARKWAAFTVWGVDVGFGRPAAMTGYYQEAKAIALARTGKPMAAQTQQWVLDQKDAYHGVNRSLDEAAMYPMWERVRPTPHSF